MIPRDYKLTENKHIKRLGKLSTELYDRIFNHVSVNGYPGFNKRLIHLADAVDCGTISPMEGYDAINQLETIGYLPMFIDCRESNYSHTI
jgi:hypothetical protein